MGFWGLCERGIGDFTLNFFYQKSADILDGNQPRPCGKLD